MLRYERQHAGSVSFAGHSLGGSLSKVLAARLVVSGQRRGSDVHVHTFGSPPAFSCSCGGHGTQILQHLRIPSNHLRNWVRCVALHLLLLVCVAYGRRGAGPFVASRTLR